MFVVLLRFSTQKHLAGHHMDGHNAWVQRGLDEGVFLLVGGLQQGMGGGILADNTSRQDLQQRIAADPFVAENVVTAEILELTPNKTDARLAFLLERNQ
jgi:uncharacterized protein YciI